MSSPDGPIETASPVSSAVVRGTLWTFGGSVLPQVLTILTSVLVARFLGVESLGRVTFISFVAVTVSTLFSLGFPSSVQRHIAEGLGQGEAGAIRGLMSVAWRVGAAAALAGAAVVAAAAAAGAEPEEAWLLASVLAGGVLIHKVPSALLIGCQRWREASIAGLVSSTLATSVKVVVLVAGGGIVSLFVVDAVFVVVNVVVTTLYARRVLRTLPAVAPRGDDLVRRVARFGLIASLGTLISWVVYQRSELFFLNRYSTDEQIALYSVPFSAVVALLFFPQAIATALSPAFASLFGAGRLERIHAAFSSTLRLVLTSTLLVTAFSMAVGPSLLLLLYGPEFEDAVPVLEILLVTMPFVPLLALSQALFLGIGRQWVPLAIGGAAAVLNLGLDFLLIPAFDAVGAAVANSAAQVAGALALVTYARVLIGGLDLRPGAVARALVVSAVAGGAAATVAFTTPPLLGALAGSLVFVAAAGVLVRLVPVLPGEDARALDDRFGGRGRGVVGRVVRYAARL